MGTRWKLLAILLFIGIIIFFWSNGVERSNIAEQREAPIPSVTSIDNFFQFPWEITRSEALKLAEERSLTPTPKGFMDYRGSDLLYNISFAGCPAIIRCRFQERLQQNYSFFYRGSIYLSSKTCAVEKLYRQFHKEMTDRYGAVPDLGYPPRRNSGADKPWAPGSGSVWAVKSPDGQIFEIMTELDLSNPGFLRLSYHNISMERKFKNLVNPTPEGDPTQADTDLAGFMGIPWGASPVQFKREMEGKGLSPVTEDTSPNNRSAHSWVQKGSVAGYPVQSINAYFKHDSMYMVSVSINGDKKDNGDADYRRLNEYLQSQYGKPVEEKNFCQETVHIWPFPLEGFKPNHIMLHRNGSTIMLLYKSRALEDKLNNL
ncbi:MAG: hypothetical protein AB9917_01755 [Negativicutes bacterium]